MSTIRVASRKLVAAVLLLAAAAALATPRSAYADTPCTDDYEVCLMSAQGKHWLMRELAYQECFWKWTGCVLASVI